MAEVLAVIGTIGAVCNIVDVIGKTISVIGELQSRWKTADLGLLSLVSQLTALRAALTQIERWLENNTEHMHHQLTMDLDISLSCCRLLATELEAFFTQLHASPDHALTTMGKIRVVLGHQGANDIQKFIEHQVSSLTLLLTACNCTTLYEQRQLLEKPRTRKTLAQTKADSVSLLVHRDSASHISKWTDNLSKLSCIFDFDPEVLRSRVYERIFRNMLKQSRAQPPPALPPDPRHLFLLFGDNDVAKVMVEKSILSCYPFEMVLEAKLLASEGSVLQQACVKYTLEIVKLLYGSESDLCDDAVDQLLSEGITNTGVAPFVLHVIATFWHRPVLFHYMMKEYNQALKKPEFHHAHRYIAARMRNWMPLHPAQSIDDTTVSPSSRHPCSMSFVVDQLPVALLTPWTIGYSIVPPLNGLAVPAAIFYVVDLDARTIQSRLKQTTEFFQQLQSPRDIPLVILFMDRWWWSEEERLERIEKVLPKVREATKLPFRHFIASIDDPLALNQFVSKVMLETASEKRGAEETLVWKAN